MNGDADAIPVNDARTPVPRANAAELLRKTALEEEPTNKGAAAEEARPSVAELEDAADAPTPTSLRPKLGERPENGNDEGEAAPASAKDVSPMTSDEELEADAASPPEKTGAGDEPNVFFPDFPAR